MKSVAANLFVAVVATGVVLALVWLYSGDTETVLPASAKSFSDLGKAEPGDLALLSAGKIERVGVITKIEEGNTFSVNIGHGPSTYSKANLANRTIMVIRQREDKEAHREWSQRLALQMADLSRERLTVTQPSTAEAQ